VSALVGDFYLDPPQDWILQNLRYAGVFDPHVTNCVLLLLAGWAQGAAFVDCGAHVGVHSIAAAWLGACPRVLAVEMMRQTCDHLRRNVRLNGAAAQKVTVARAVLSSAPGNSVTVAAGAKNECNTGMARVMGVTAGGDGRSRPPPARGPFGGCDREVSAAEPCDLRTTTLDRVVAEHMPPGARVGVIKVDVEGHEVEVLRGAAQTLKQWQPACIVEVWDDSEMRAHGVGLTQAEVVAEIEAIVGVKGHRLARGGCDFLFLPGGDAQALQDVLKHGAGDGRRALAGTIEALAARGLYPPRRLPEVRVPPQCWGPV